MPAVKDKERKTWYANFYYIDWTGAKIHKCKRGFKKQKEALDWERTFLDQQSKSPTILLSNLVANYMEDMSHRLKPTTMANKKLLIEQKIIPTLGKLPINEIQTNTIRKWQTEMIKGNYAPTYLKTINNQLSALLNYAVAYYNLPSNPCKIAGSMGKKKADSMKIWTKEQYEQFISFENKRAAKVAFDILFFSGIREGELLALEPADILDTMKMDINKSFAVLEGEELIMDPKTPKSNRCISIPEFLYNEIKDYINSIYGLEEHDRIFYFTKSFLLKEIKRVSKLVGLKPIRVHDLRHSHASLLIELDYSILAISERLGHESASTTLDTYAHLYPGKDKKLSEDLNKLRQSKLLTSF